MPASLEIGIAPDHFDLPCPHCGPNCRSTANQKRKVMRIWSLGQGVETFHCVRCGARGRLDARAPREIIPEQKRKSAISLEQRTRLARRLWQDAQTIGGTPAEQYLRIVRAYGGRLPPTLRYLPANGRHPHAMIAAFGLVPEVSCGELETPLAPPAIHLTRLEPDASGRLNKIMIGRVSGHPIVLAPPNDGLGLAITEGIEDALSLHEATGLGAWAAGSASHMAKLAPPVPTYAEWITLAEDDDTAGRKAVGQLARELTQWGLRVSVMALARRA